MNSKMQMQGSQLRQGFELGSDGEIPVTHIPAPQIAGGTPGGSLSFPLIFSGGKR